VKTERPQRYLTDRAMATATAVADLKKQFNTFLRENKCPTGEIVKKKYYFPVNRLKVSIV
jgi:hypothetical protein